MAKYHYGPDPDHFPFLDEAIARIREVGDIEEGYAVTFQEGWLIVRGEPEGMFVVHRFEHDGKTYFIALDPEVVFGGGRSAQSGG
jgi:hypothetical protein